MKICDYKIHRKICEPAIWLAEPNNVIYNWIIQTKF
jgi:hypothetical protein